MNSTITAQTSPCLNAFSTDSKSPKSKSFISCCALIGAMILGLSVTATAADVRP